MAVGANSPSKFTAFGDALIARRGLQRAHRMRVLTDQQSRERKWRTVNPFCLAMQPDKKETVMNRKSKHTSGQHARPENTMRTKDRLPPDPEGMNDHRASVAKELVRAFCKACQVDRQDAVADLLCNMMHLCDRDHRLGGFDAGLIRAYRHYRAETATDAEYARM